MRKTIAAGLTALVACTALLTGCSGSGGSGTTQRIDIAVKGDTVHPNGSQVAVPVGKPITLHVSADAPGEIHVHSSPEHEFTYGKGTTDLKLTLDRPGVVEVESHTLDKVIVQLEAQ
ncbi:MAG: hypothetical protein ACXVW6_08375 [Nocardioidaceae bacterium]